MNRPEAERDRLEWTAFLYAAGELPVADSDAFEAELAESQPAREAVARAVEIRMAVQSAERTLLSFAEPADPATSPARTRSAGFRLVERLGWMGSGVAAAWLAVVCFSGNAVSPGPRIDGNATTEAPRVAEATRPALPLHELPQGWAVEVAMLAGGDGTADEPVAGDWEPSGDDPIEAGSAVPGWLLQAVSAGEEGR